ncbi:MAG: AIR synthase related protein [Flavobacteriaceae bacterium]
MDIKDLGFSTIHLGHGSGGELTRKLLDNIIFTTFNNKYLNQKHDGSIVKMNSNIAISTDSFVITPIFFKGGNIGELAVNGTVNDVAMCGAIPKYISLAFIIEEGLKIREFVAIVNSIKSSR